MIDIANTLPELPPHSGMHPGEKAYRDKLKPQIDISGKDGIARIPIEGSLAHNPDTWEMAYFGMEDLRNIASMVQEAKENPDVKGALLAVDSPGGFFTGSLDVADGIAALNKVKPVVAHISGTSASLAYMLTSQAGEIVAGRGSSVGSLGAYIVNADYSRAYKNAGLEMEMFKNREGSLKGMGGGEFALTQEQRQFLSDRAQGTFESFMNIIETARGVIQPDAKKGQTFYGEEAKAKGLVDRIGSESFARGLLKAKL